MDIPHVPVVEPPGMLHVSPEQQSAEVVHAPPAITHAAPHLPLTHGSPQQSALLAHVMPTLLCGFEQSMLWSTPQRGIPSESWWHVSNCCTLPAQQLSVALHETDCRRQMAPAGAHTLPLSQWPTGKPGCLLQCTFAIA